MFAAVATVSQLPRFALNDPQHRPRSELASDQINLAAD
jgi:hypothetical protein